MSATSYLPGMAVLVHGEQPARVESVDDRGRVVVRFFGAAPAGYPQPATVMAAHLTRPPGWRLLDRRGDRSWSTKPTWSGADLRTLRREFPRRPIGGVAALLGRSPAACKIAFQRWWGRVSVHRDGRVLSLRAVARALAVDEHRVLWLIDRGYLRAAPSGVAAGANERWAITEDALGAFLERQRAHYDWRRMPPSPWRAFAERVDAADPLLTVEEAGRRVGVTASALVQRINRGQLAGVWSSTSRLERGRRGNRGWLVRAADLPALAAALAAPRVRRVA